MITHTVHSLYIRYIIKQIVITCFVLVAVLVAGRATSWLLAVLVAVLVAG
jgi:hypothetical protein